MGVQVAAPFGHERRLLELAYELEAAPPLAGSPADTDVEPGLARPGRRDARRPPAVDA